MTDVTRDDPIPTAPAAHAPQGSQRGRERIKGVFSTQDVKKVGTGTTTRKTIQKGFWYAEETEKGDVEVQPLNNNYVPSGPKRLISMDELLEKFAPEPAFYVQTVFPRMRELNKTVARADRHRQKGETFSAEYEYGNALQVDDENVRANFGLGLTYLSRGETGKADDIFERLVKLEAAFDEEHKHLFNEFGINLRKNQMFDQAVAYYTRALELTRKDENLHLNMARAMLEKKNFTGTVEHVLKALEINPAIDAGIKFLQWMQAKKLVPAEQQDTVREVLARIAGGGKAPAADDTGGGGS
ncbi:Tetratricopeptide repeat protein [anaerobic digester metagenome]